MNITNRLYTHMKINSLHLFHFAIVQGKDKGRRSSTRTEEGSQAWSGCGSWSGNIGVHHKHQALPWIKSTLKSKKIARYPLVIFRVSTQFLRVETQVIIKANPEHPVNKNFPTHLPFWMYHVSRFRLSERVCDWSWVVARFSCPVS